MKHISRRSWALVAVSAASLVVAATFFSFLISPGHTWLSSERAATFQVADGGSERP